MNQAIQAQGPVRVFQPRVDVYENADELLLLADMPGASAESVNIRYEDELLTLQAQRTAADGPNLRFQRAFQVPDSVDPEQISAELKQGVLHVHLRKTAKAKPRSIEIRSA
jgi:HSP20 family molecular chaperone IbpA